MSDFEEKTCKEDSKQPTLGQDLVISILERLSFSDFHRARCISREWYYASKSCIRVTSPWIILFPDDEHDVENNNSCKLFDPRDCSCYTVRDLGFDMARGRCLASSGSWFLMSDHRVEFHILNLFTRETIPLPPLESTDGCPMEFVRINDYNVWVTLNHENKTSRKKTSYYTAMGLRIGKAVLWVDEETRDYLVVWNYEGFFAYHKKGDDNYSWKVLEPLQNQRCVDMVYNESKLYVLSDTRVTVLDFSRGDSPMERASFKSPSYRDSSFHEKNLAVTLSGEVLIVTSNCEPYLIYLVDVYKMDPKSLEWIIINSIGDEALLLDLGITVAANDGVMKNCIYFSVGYGSYYSVIDFVVYHIETRKVVLMEQFRATSYPISCKSARWFLNGCFKPTSSSAWASITSWPPYEVTSSSSRGRGDILFGGKQDGLVPPM